MTVSIHELMAGRESQPHPGAPILTDGEDGNLFCPSATYPEHEQYVRYPLNRTYDAGIIDSSNYLAHSTNP